VVKPRAKRAIIKAVIKERGYSERKACGLIQMDRSSYRHQSQDNEADQSLRKRLKQLAVQYPAYGYLLLHGMLKQEGLVINKKRTYRIYTEEQMQVRTKRRKKLKRPRMPIELPNKVNQRWSMDFVSDQLSDGRRFRLLNVVDDFSRECVGQLVASSINGAMVGRFLDQLIDYRGTKPGSIVCDNGPEFTCKVMFFWVKEQNIRLAFIQPGKPTQNAFVESFNGKFRAALLNQYWFRDMAEARQEINQWRSHYNEERPHSSLNYLPPSQFAKQAA
jgi:putative transposase